MANKSKLINMAQKAMGRGQWDKAISYLEKVLQEDPQNVRTMLKLGDVYAKKGDRERAIEVYQKVAEHHAAQGFFLKAVAVYKQILKLDTRNGVAALRIAELHEQLGLAQDALVHFQLALPVLEEQGLHDQALGVLQHILDIDAENVAARIKLAESYSRLNDRAQAVQQFALAAQVLKQQGRIEDYVKVSERLIYHDPQRADVVKDLAKLYLSRGDIKRGLAKLQICFRETPRDVEILTLLAQAFSNLDQVQKTVYVYRELARVHEDEGRHAEALEVHRLILQHHPTDQEALRALGMLEDRLAEPPPEPLDVELNVEQPVNSFGFQAPPDNATGAIPLHATQDLLNAAVDSGFDHNVTDMSEPDVLFGDPTNVENTSSPHMSVHTRLSNTSSRLVSQAPNIPPDTSPPYISRQNLTEDIIELPLYAENISSSPSPNAAVSRAGINLHAEEHVERIVKEADIYIRYNLPNKALEHLELGYQVSPGHPALYRRAHDAWLALNDYQRAASAIAKAMLAFQKVGDQAAVEETRGLLKAIAPDHRALQTEEGANHPSVDLFRRKPEINVEDIDVDTGEFASEEKKGPPIQPQGNLPSPFLPTQLDQRSWQTTTKNAETVPALGTPVAASGYAASQGLELFADEHAPSDSINLYDHLSPLDPDPSQDGDSDATLDDDLAEIIFFVDAGLYENARAAFEDFERSCPNHPRIEEYRALVNGDPEQSTTRATSRPGQAADPSVEGTNSTTSSPLNPEPTNSSGVIGKAPLTVEEEEAEALFSVWSPEIGSSSGSADEDGSEGNPADELYDQGMAHKQIGQLEDAIAAFRKAADMAPEGATTALEMLGHCLVEQSKLADAAKAFQEALNNCFDDSASTNLHYELGHVHELMQEFESARLWFESCQKLNPQHRDVGLRLLNLSKSTLLENTSNMPNA